MPDWRRRPNTEGWWLEPTGTEPVVFDILKAQRNDEGALLVYVWCYGDEDWVATDVHESEDSWYYGPIPEPPGEAFVGEDKEATETT